MFETEITRFRELFRLGICAVKEASRIYVRAIDRDASAKQAFREQIPEVPYTAWTSFEKIGRGQMHENLLLIGGRVQTMMKTLPYSEQVEALDNGIEVLLHDGTTMRIMPESLTQSQISQVFENGNIRTVEGQRAWMESRRDYDLPYVRSPKNDYSVEGMVLVINAPMSFSFTELKDILKRMEMAKC